MVKKFAPIEEVNHKVKSFWGLERIVQLHYEGTVYSLEDLPLNFGRVTVFKTYLWCFQIDPIAGSGLCLGPS